MSTDTPSHISNAPDGEPYGSPSSFIHYQRDRVDYTVNDSELRDLQRCSDNFWKDLCLTSGTLGITTLLNAIHLFSFPGDIPPLGFVANFIGAAVGILFSAACGSAWYKTSQNAERIVTDIKNKPKIKLPDG